MDSRLILAAAVVAALATSLAVAQTPPTVDDSQTPPPPPPSLLPPPPEIGPAVEPPPRIVKPRATVERPVVAAPPPPAVLRSPVAILQVLDKVTAETLRFEAPVGRRVRYKTLVVEVRACETRGYVDPEPRASAYLIVDTRTAPIQASESPRDREVFRGWTFAFTPSLHAVEHPIYDLWLVACGTAPAA
jgi:hypothetical protein